MPDSCDAPPAILDRALEVGPDDWQGPAFYQLLTALVVPRPIDRLDLDRLKERGAQPGALFVL